MTKVIRLRVDDTLLTVSKKLLLKYPNCVFSRIIINNESDEDFLIVRDEGTLYIDINPDNLKLIVKLMRGYKCESNEDIKLWTSRSMTYDLERFGLSEFIYKEESSSTEFVIVNDDIKTTINNIKEINEEEQEDNNDSEIIKEIIETGLSYNINENDKESDKESINEYDVYNDYAREYMEKFIEPLTTQPVKIEEIEESIDSITKTKKQARIKSRKVNI